MESGNSGSLQSSSNGDEEYDSRAAADPISAFMTTRQTSAHLGHITAPPPPLFDPLPNYIHSNPPLLHPNPTWPRTQRSDPNTTTHDIINNPPHFYQLPTLDNNNNNNHAVAPAPPQTAARNPKKRSRASRRAPTTVLTTDTTNFRAMVQEFTGIPAAPFSNSALPRSRLDLFGSAQPPPYLRRPFAQKVQSPPPVNITQNNSNLFNINPNPFLSSLLQTNPKFDLFSNSSSMAASKLPDHPNDHSNIKMDGLDYVTGLPNLISSDQIAPRNDNNNHNVVGPDEGDHYEARMRSVNGGYNFSRNTTSSTNFNGEKVGSDQTRGEGMVESWICSSELK